MSFRGIVKDLLIRNAEDVFRKMIPRYEEIIEKFQLYAKTDDQDIIAYLVVYMLVNTASETVIGSTLDMLLRLDTNIVTINLFFEHKPRFALQISVYTITGDDKETVVYIHNETNNKDDMLSRVYEKRSNVSKCSKDETVPFSRLHVCPYVVLEVSEMSKSTMEDILHLDEEYLIGKPSSRLIRWEYEIQGTDMRVCLETYMKVYDYMLPSVRQAFKPNQNNVGVKQSFYLVSASLCLCSVCLLVLPLMTVYNRSSITFASCD